ncbi:16S rRNA (cytosine(1402)-N(4))-methyltransferase RsmH [bacterium]|nr:16S rRNA (cytosine(1402)-N(4))-methyltransferase RsmH [bacterium]
MPEEVLHWLDLKVGGTYVDGTAGAGGHSCLIAHKVGPQGRVIGLDRDAAMLELARRTAADQGMTLDLHRSSYADAGTVLERLGIDAVDGFLVDLGLSSDQLAWTDRGFSFQSDGPLDMRFDVSGDRPTAAEIVNEWTETELADIFWKYGEERHSRRLARAIVERRRTAPFDKTGDFAQVIRRAMPGPRGRIDPCTRVFQGLRIAVNDELGELERLLERVHEWVRPGGRFVVISFHSLEDRMVKHFLRDSIAWEVLTRKVVTATEAEQEGNPRSRSAKLRAARRRSEAEEIRERNL